MTLCHLPKKMQRRLYHETDKKIMASLLAAAIVSAAASMSVFAETVTESDQLPKTDSNFKVSYNYSPDVSPKFTVTIPAGVTLLDDAATTADITAEGVENPGGKKINVALTSGTYTTEGSTFHAKNGDSVVTYTISKGNDTVSVGDKVAVFEDNGTETLTFSKPDKTNATVAGEHTENLTFTVSVEDVFPIGCTLKEGDTVNLGNSVYVYFTDSNYEISGDYTLSYMSYDYGVGVHNYALTQGNNVAYFIVPDDNSAKPTAITVTGGSGTSTDPYTFTAVH